ncbi:MAG: hypothetical protein AVDCRST_MAG70-776 [uncultured Thermomicrobiales bacterium]|uniref:Uncharacterized protein n=1 Tax=uncultured Thermomicrobiales bacterium TaxID=1645740 RepID=A0A6J4UGQ7_9BACT|nr:MAG: hypothetical protein AVDCRST_MAG70-776 [uncultured Thermomicrobiales bacterium]
MTLSTSSRRAAGLGSIVLGAGIAISAILGPLALKVITFRTSANLENQFIGGEVVSLGVVAPAAIAAGVLWLRGHRLAPALALGPALYAVYTYTTVVIGQEYARYDGNVERFFPLYAGLVAGGAAIAVAAWSRLGETQVPTPSDRLRRTVAGIFLGLGSFFALAWAAQIRLVVIGQPTAEYQEGPTIFWVIKLLDVGFLIPLLIATGAGLLGRKPAAIRAAYGLSAFASCLVGSIAGMAVAMEVKGDPSAQPAMLAILLPATAGLAFTTSRLLRSFAQHADPPPTVSTLSPGRTSLVRTS